MPSLRHIDFIPELTFKTSRSSGSGGQHVNKVETKVELIYNLAATHLLDDHQKQQILLNLADRYLNDHVVHIVESSSRSQLRNKKAAIEKLYNLLEEALEERKERKPTELPESIKKKRLKSKKIQAEKKANRGWKME